LGRSGPAAEPVSIRKLRGETRPSLIGGEGVFEPEALEVVPEPPKFLPRGARSVWRRVAPDLVRYRIISALDLDLLAHYAMAVDLARRAAEEIDVLSGGSITVQQLIAVRKSKDEDVEDEVVAQVVTKPAFKAWREAVAEVRRLAGEFGLTPAIRASVKLPSSDTGKADPARASALLSR
jgi:P27 family predicted phage terminase small subunit